jgi:hypothetical protein
MPSPHPRIGLVLDAGLRDALDVLRRRGELSQPQAALARRAVFEGALLEAILLEACSDSPTGAAALAVLREIREIVGQLSMPRSVADAVIDEIDRVTDRARARERRARQLALVESPNPHGRAALEVAERIDALDGVV